MAEIKIDLNIDVMERLQQETDASVGMAKALGNYLLERFKEDEFTRNQYFNKKVTLDDCVKAITDQARKYLNSLNGCVEDKIVFGWLVDFIQDGTIKEKKDNQITITKEDKEELKARVMKKLEEEELEKARKEKQKEIEREVKSQEKKEKKYQELAQDQFTLDLDL